MTMEFGLLGPLVVRSGGSPVPVSRGRERTLLAALLLSAGQVVPVTELTVILWGASPPPSARVTIQNHVKRLRQALGAEGGRIATQAGGYLIRVDPGELDVAVFEERLDAARAAVRAGSWAAAADAARAALALWRGEPLADVDSGTLVTREARRLADLRLEARQAGLDADLQLGRLDTVIPEARRLAAEHPLREHVHGLLMLALYRDGRPAEAAAAYERARQVLADELGTAPGPRLRDLYRTIVAADPARPAAADARNTLPPDTAAFTGRRAELDAIAAAAAEADGPGGVVAIRAIGGMPGVGKTALAVRAAHLLANRFPDRQLFLGLHGHAPDRDPLSPADALAVLLGATGVDSRGLPPDLDGRAALWRDKMAGQRAVLVLDNAASSAQVTPLLPGSGSCLVLITSRRHLADLPGAVTPVLVEVLAPAAAAEMFTWLAPRAAAEPPGAVAGLVALAGHLPLAISLLARLYARHPAWSLADLAAETRASMLTLAPEADSVGAAFELSYRHLDAGGRDLLDRLGLHPGTTADRHAAAALAGLTAAGAARQLDRLHAEGLLTETGYRRYGMHDLIRQYAARRAAARPADQARAALGRLLDYYQGTAATAAGQLARPRPAAVPAAAGGPDLAGPPQAARWLRAERANLLACLDFATRSGQDARVVGLTAGVAELLQRDGPWAEAMARHAAAAQAAARLGDRAGRAGARLDEGIVRRSAGDFSAAAGLLAEALGIFADLGDRDGQAWATAETGSLRRLSDDFAGAEAALGEALAAFRDLGDRRGQATVLDQLGQLRRVIGSGAAATEVLTQARDLYASIGDAPGQARAMTYLADARRLDGDHAGSAALLQEALRLLQDSGDRRGRALALAQLGQTQWVARDLPAAAATLEQALAVFGELGDRLGQANVLVLQGNVHRETGDFAAAAQAMAAGLRLYRELGSQFGLANVLVTLGELQRKTGDYGDAAATLAEGEVICRSLGYWLGLVNALRHLGGVHRETGELAAARPLLADCLALAREHDLRPAEGEVLNETGALDLALGETARAAEHYRLALGIAREFSIAHEEATALAGLAAAGAA